MCDIQKFLERASSSWRGSSWRTRASFDYSQKITKEIASYVGMIDNLLGIDYIVNNIELINYCCDLDVRIKLTEGECRLFSAILHNCVRLHKSKCLELLVQIEKFVKRGERFDFDLRDKYGNRWNIFHNLCYWGDLEVLEGFLQVVNAVTERHLEDVNYPEINLNAETCRNETGILIACKLRIPYEFPINLAFIKRCIESGLIDISDGRIYFAAINSGNRELCEYLYTVYPIDPNHCSAKGLSLLERAIVSGKLPTFEWLLSLPGLDINSFRENKTPFMIALEEKQLEMCKKIIVHPEFNLLPTGCDPELVTALDYVKDPSVYELVPILLSKLRELSDNKYYQEIIKKQIDRSMYDKSKVLIEFLMSSEFPIIFNNGDFEVSV